MRQLTARLLLSLALLIPAQASAEVYEVFVDIDTEEDLYDLLTDGEIEEDTFNTLLEIYQRGIDINDAGRAKLYTLPNLTYRDVDGILEYRDEAGSINNPADLVANDVLTQKQLSAIAPFLWKTDRAAPKQETKGSFRLQSRLSGKNDRYPPASAFQGQLRALGKLHMGVAAVLVRNRLSDVRYDPSRDALSAVPNKTVPIVPKFYVEWDDDGWAAIAGTYRIGFGQRLTFDSTSEITPNGFRGDDQIRRENDLQRRCRDSTGELEGSPCAGEAGGVRVTPDYKWTNRLTGFALGLKKLKLKKGHMQAYTWGSYQVNSIYQYELYDQNRCDDPRNDDDDNCKAPPVFRRADPLVDTSALSYQTLPRMYAEMLAGGNFTYHIDERTHVGLTGYGANVRWLVDGLDLDFQEYASTPFGGPYGAVGVDAAVGFGIQDFFMEVSRSFDSQVDDGNGGFGAILRSVTGLANTELEVSARYYDKKFNNPYGRPISAPDEFDGRRARDEIGLRVQSESDFGKKVSLRTKADIWHASADDVLQLELFARTDIDWTKKFATAVWATYRNKNLGNGGREQCYDETNEETDTGEAVPCFGQLIRTAARAQYKPQKKLELSLQYQHEWRDDKDYDDRFRQDIAAIFGMSVRPIDRLNIRARVRYDWDDIADNAREEHTLWSYFDVGVKVRENDWIRARYDLRFWLDDRDSTALREPSPEHWLWLVYEAKF